jgi:hypothetical protein
MASFFARHRVDLEAQGARPGEDGYPSAGAIAWMLWGGDPSDPDGAGVAWAARKVEEIDRQTETSAKAEREERLDRARKRIAQYEAQSWAAAQDGTMADEMRKRVEAVNERQAKIMSILKVIADSVVEGDE